MKRNTGIHPTVSSDENPAHFRHTGDRESLLEIAGAEMWIIKGCISAGISALPPAESKVNQCRTAACHVGRVDSGRRPASGSAQEDVRAARLDTHLTDPPEMLQHLPWHRMALRRIAFKGSLMQ